MEIPHQQLSDEALLSVIEEYISREGTDYGHREYSFEEKIDCLLYTSPSPRDGLLSRMPSSA